jgi:cbb3-type cytochrome oxidase subunit 1
MVNFFMTMRTRWYRTGEDVALRFFATGAIFWALTCLQGISQSFRSFSMQVHLTNWVIGHSHLAFVAAYSFWAFAMVYMMVPQLVQRRIFSRKLMEWHFWLTILGMIIFMVALWAAGLIQGQNWMTNTIPFIQTMRSMEPYFALRLLGGSMAGVGILCFVYNIWQTTRQPLAEVLSVPSIAAEGGAGR